METLMGRPDSLVLATLVKKLARRSSLTTDEAEALVALPCRVSRLPAGSFIQRAGEPTATCGVLLSGFAYRHQFTRNSARQILAVHLRGDLLGFHDGLLGVSDDNIQALTAVELAHISRQALADVASEHPGIGRA